MSRRRRYDSGDPDPTRAVQRHVLEPGKRALTDHLVAPVQRRSSAAPRPDADTQDTHEIAAAGVAGRGAPLPHLARIQEAFGRHEVSHVEAHVDGAATSAALAIGAEAFATGSHVAFATAPDLYTASHEAAHVVQQAQGVQLAAGVGTAGDVHEGQADAVADAVVAGRSAESILDEVPSGAPAAGVQRKDLPVPNTAREVEVVVFERGSASLVVKVINSMGDTAAAGAATKDVGPIDDASWSALEPKMVTEANSLGVRLEAALIKSEFSLDLFEGLALSLELTGPEGSFDLENGGDLSLAQIELKAVADLATLGGLQAPPGKTFKVEVIGSFTIGGKLLAKLAEMAERAEVIAAKADELGKIADDLGKAEALDEDLSTKRKVLVAQRDALPGDWEGREARADLDAKIRGLDAEISENRARIHASAARSGALQRELADEAKKLTALEKKLDGKIARKLAGRITKAAAKKIAAAVGKLLPVLALVATIADVVAVIQLLNDWAEHDFDLPTPGSAGPFGEISWDEGEEGGGPRPEEGADDGSSGSADKDTGSIDGDDGGGDAKEGRERPKKKRGSSKRKPEAEGDVPVSVPDQLHRHAKAVLEVIERKCVRLDEAQVRALERVVPPTLTDDEAVQLLQVLISQGESLAEGQDAHDVLAAVDEAVRGLHPEAMRVKIDGKDRPDLGLQPQADERALDGASRDEAQRERGAGDDQPKDTSTAYDLGVIVEKLPESVVESWLSFRRGLESDGFDSWRDENLGARIPGKDGWELLDSTLLIDRAAEGDLWSVAVTFQVRTPSRERSIEHYFFVDQGEDGLPTAERINMFTVTQ